MTLSELLDRYETLIRLRDMDRKYQVNGRHVTYEIADVRRDIFTLVGRIANGEVSW